MEFRTLNDFLLPPPLPAVVSLLIVLSAVGISEAVIARLNPFPSPAHRGAAFILVLALAGALAHGLVLIHHATPDLLRILAFFLAVIGCPLLFHQRRSFKVPHVAFRDFWRAASFAERLSSLAITASVLGLTLAALGPVTDADSLDYHLGIPLDWLRNSGLAPQPHWMHARLTGLGEGLNLLGLAAGTDGLGALVQIAGLLVILTAVASLAKSPRDRLFSLLLALPPTVIPLAVAQKPQLFPAAAVIVAFILTRTAIAPLDFALIFGCLAFAMASKYMFFVSGGVVMVAALARARHIGALSRALVSALVAVLVFVAPVLARNYFLYGDPVSPFLESLRAAPDSEVTDFAAFLSNAGGEHTIAGIRHFIAGLVVPDSPGDIQVVLGVGVFSVLLAAASEWSALSLLSAAAVLLFTVWRGQMAPRFLLEPFIWCVIAAAAAPWTRLKSVLYYAVAAQTTCVAVLALLGAVLLFPGALTPHLRDLVMRRSTYGYQQAQWLDRVLPPDAVIVSDLRANALSPRPFAIPAGYAFSPGFPLLDLMSPVAQHASSGQILVMDTSTLSSPAPGCELKTVAGPEPLVYATRNPWNSRHYEAIAVRLTCH